MKDFKIAFREVLPIFVTYIFLGMACGVLFAESGFKFYHLLLSAGLMYGGSMSFIVAPLLSTGASLFLVFLMSLFINGRQLFYAVAFLDKYKTDSFLEKMYLALTLTDEVYSIEVKPSHGRGVENMNRFNIYVHFLAHFFWISGNCLGFLSGELLPFDLTGIEFSATTFFFIVVIDQFLAFPSHLPVYIGLASGLVCLFIFGPNNFILPALIVSVIILSVFRVKLERKLMS